MKRGFLLGGASKPTDAEPSSAATSAAASSSTTTKRASFSIRAATRPRLGPPDANFVAAAAEEEDANVDEATSNNNASALILDDATLSRKKAQEGGILAEAGRWNAKAAKCALLALGRDSADFRRYAALIRDGAHRSAPSPRK